MWTAFSLILFELASHDGPLHLNIHIGNIPIIYLEYRKLCESETGVLILISNFFYSQEHNKTPNQSNSQKSKYLVTTGKAPV